jgi:dATP pyrophosphohydrolase
MNLRHDNVICHVARPTADGASHEFLQLRRAPGRYPHMAGAWSPVRGRVESGETAWQAAARELREETGLVPVEFYQLDTIDQFYLAADDHIWLVPGFLALVAAGATVTLNPEHDAARWVPRATVDRHFLWPGERAQLAEACREILDDGPARPYLRVELTPPSGAGPRDPAGG